MEGAVAKLILDSLDNNNDSKGTLGDVFQNYIDSLKKVEEEAEAKVLDDRDAILAQKLKILKACELNKDLGWFDYDSWNTFPKSMQEFFSSKIDVLFYGGVFFPYSKLVEIEKELWELLPMTHNITVLNDGGNFHVHCVGPEDLKYGWLGEHAIKDMQKKFRNNTIRSVGRTSTGVVERVNGVTDEQ